MTYTLWWNTQTTNAQGESVGEEIHAVYATLEEAISQGRHDIRAGKDIIGVRDDKHTQVVSRADLLAE